MALISVKNPDLYKSWIKYLEKQHKDKAGYEIRTEAFFNSQQNIPIPYS